VVNLRRAGVKADRRDAGLVDEAVGEVEAVARAGAPAAADLHGDGEL
jgi:hypothetical protein